MFQNDLKSETKLKHTWENFVRAGSGFLEILTSKLNLSMEDKIAG